MGALYDAKISMQMWSLIFTFLGCGIIISVIVKLMLTRKEKQAFYVALILVLLVLIINKLFSR